MKHVICYSFRNKWFCSLVKIVKNGWKYVCSASVIGRRLVLLFIIVSLCSTVAYGQELKTVRGKVVEEETGEPLSMVNIAVIGTTLGTVTQEDGTYQLEVPSLQDTLVFSYIGFQTQTVPINGRTDIDISLKTKAFSAKELVVVGYGKQKEANLTGAISTVSADKVAKVPVGQASSALQGLTPGVTVTKHSGKPGGDGGTIRIRGIGTLGDADPLVLIDGVVGDINNINPNMIASISILKDAASAAIYGSRAANGVILITTKRAQSDKLIISYNGYTGWQRPTNMPDKVDAIDHMLMLNKAYVNTGKDPIYSEELINKYRTKGAENRDRYPNTNWQEKVLSGSGFMQSHFMSISGGGDRIRFVTSVGYFDQRGLLETSGFKRYTLRNNMDIKFSNKLSMKIDFKIADEITKAPGRGTASVFHEMTQIPATHAGKFSNGKWGPGWNGDNPIAFSRLDGGLHKINDLNLILHASLNYNPFEWLEAEISFAPKYNRINDHQFIKSIQTYYYTGEPAFTQPAKTSLEEERVTSLYKNFKGTLTFNKRFENHNIKLLLGTSRSNFSTSDLSAYREMFVFDNYPVIDAGSENNMQNSGSEAAWALQSFFGRFNYNYKQKYLLEVTGRYDGSSRFSKGHKYGFFPSVSLGWRISEEPFMQSIQDIVNELKLRASWGMLGNQEIGYYPFTTTIDLGSYTFNKDIVDIAALNTMSNPNITWETTEMINLGLDLKLFNKLSVTANYYFRQTRDILLRLNIPLTVGLNAPFQNAGIVNNKGWELRLNYIGDIDEFNYSITLNISDVKNEVVEMHGIKQTGIVVNREGYPMNSIYGLQAKGLFQSKEEIANHADQFGNVKPGDIKYKDINDDGVINSDDKVIIGSTIPRYTFGAMLDASYKGFDLSVFFQGVGKGDGLLYEDAIMPFAAGGTVFEQHKDYWTPENRDATFPRLAFGQTNNKKISSYWLKDASYIRLKNLQIGYTFSNDIVQILGLSYFRIYVNGRNLLTLDNFWPGYDVASPVGDGDFYPFQKVYSMGINIKF